MEHTVKGEASATITVKEWERAIYPNQLTYKVNAVNFFETVMFSVSFQSPCSADRSLYFQTGLAIFFIVIIRCGCISVFHPCPSVS